MNTGNPTCGLLNYHCVIELPWIVVVYIYMFTFLACIIITTSVHQSDYLHPSHTKITPKQAFIPSFLCSQILARSLHLEVQHSIHITALPHTVNFHGSHCTWSLAGY